MELAAIYPHRPEITPKLYLRSIISADPYSNLSHRDVTAHHAPDAPAILRWVWHDDRKPRRSQRFSVLHGIRYEAFWLGGKRK